MYTLKSLLMFKMQSEVHMLFKKKKKRKHKLQNLSLWKNSQSLPSKSICREMCIFGFCGYA